MVHICKAKGGYMVVNIGSNGKVLSTSEILSSKAKCWGNIKAMLNGCFVSLADHLYPGMLVQDDTEKLGKPPVYFQKGYGKPVIHKGFDPEKRYAHKSIK